MVQEPGIVEVSDYVRECLRGGEEFILYRGRASAAEAPSVLLLTPCSDMVDVNDLIREMIVMLHDEADRHSVTMRTDLTEGLPGVISDRMQLQQALMNLVLNGLEAIGDFVEHALSWFQPATRLLEMPRQCVARA